MAKNRPSGKWHAVTLGQDLKAANVRDADYSAMLEPDLPNKRVNVDPLGRYV
jgi:hypothetical protein